MEGSRPDRKRVLLWGGTVLIFGLWVAAGSYIALGYMPGSATRLGREERERLVTLIPQGWAFFTRNPREAVEYVYKWDSAGEWRRINWPNVAPRNYYGLTRERSVIRAEMKHLLGQVDDADWVSCRDSFVHCMNTAKFEQVTVVNSTRDAQLCGRIVVERRDRVPWAWSNITYRDRMPARFVKLMARCSP